VKIHRCDSWDETDREAITALVALGRPSAECPQAITLEAGQPLVVDNQSVNATDLSSPLVSPD